MSKIYLFGSYTLKYIPANIVQWLQSYSDDGHEFLVSDKKGCDEAFHKELSAVGATDNTKVYCMGEPRNNKFNIETKVFDTLYNEEDALVKICLGEEEVAEIFDVKKEMDIPGNREWMEFLDKKLAADCDMAICLWDGETKNTLRTIQLLGIKNKPCHVIKV
jgi:hypothetical protein